MPQRAPLVKPFSDRVRHYRRIADKVPELCLHTDTGRALELRETAHIDVFEQTYSYEVHNEVTAPRAYEG